MNIGFLIGANSTFYDFLSTTYKLLVGLITKGVLTFAALGAILLYVVWMGFSLGFCFSRKFYSKCRKIEKYIESNGIQNQNKIDEKLCNLSSGFAFAWKKFKKASNCLPSDVVKRRDVLDVEISGGILNQGKSLMKSYIYTITILLFIFNLALLGNSMPIDCYIVAESMVLPIIFLIVAKLFYFLYTTIKQQIYSLSVEEFYELMEKLDSEFAGLKTDSTAVTDNAAPPVSDFNDNQLENKVEEKTWVETNEFVGQEEQESTNESNFVYPVQDESKQVEDVQEKKPEEKFYSAEKIEEQGYVNEVPEAEEKQIYVNVDSNYVLKDEPGETVYNDAVVANTANETELKIPEGEVGQEDAELENEAVETEETEEPEEPETEDVVDETNETKQGETDDVDFGEFENTITQDQEETAEQMEEEFDEPEVGSNEELEQGEFDNPENENSDEIETEEYKEPNEETETEDVEVVSLDDGDELGEIGEKDEESNDIDFFGDDSDEQFYFETNETEHTQDDSLTTDDVAEQIGEQKNLEIEDENESPLLIRNSGNKIHRSEGDIEKLKENLDALMEGKDISPVDESNDDDGIKLRENSEEQMETKQGKRGRPKNNVKVVDGMQISNDEEFAECLTRAEKLMRKSEEGLSQSQSKRIEKELKALMDAMNKYKENK